MYLPRSLISQLYLQLVRTHHPLSPPVLILVALEPDALCACRILTSLLKRDYIPHKIHPVSGYGDLTKAGDELLRPMRLAEGGSGGVVACLGVGGLVDLGNLLSLVVDEEGNGGADGIELWVMDSRRPWNLNNIFGGSPPISPIEDDITTMARRQTGVDKGEITCSYRPGKGGIIVFDDGDIQEDLAVQREAWFALEAMPDLGDDDDDLMSDSDGDDEVERAASASPPRKRKSLSDEEDEDISDSDKENGRPRRRRRSNLSTPIDSPNSSPPRPRQRLTVLHGTPPSNQLSSPPPAPPTQPSTRTLRRGLMRQRRQHDSKLRAYEALGTSYAEPISSLMYSLASELGREDNDLLWLSIVGVSSTELYGHTPTGMSITNHIPQPVFTGWTGSRGARIRQLLRDEVNRLNPPELTETGREVSRGLVNDVIPTHARSPTDTSIRLSPEPRFLLIRHWSLYDSMLHSPYLSAKLHIWSDAGRRRLHKLLAKMGVSLTQCKQNYTHMDLDLKRDLRQKLLQTAPLYGLDALLPLPTVGGMGNREGWGFVRSWGWKACLSAMDVAVVIGAMLEVGPRITISKHSSSTTPSGPAEPTPSEEALTRFYNAYDALLSPSVLTTSIPIAQSFHRAILRTGTTLLQKKQIKHLRAFRMGIVKDGPDIALFVNPGALTKLALWVGQAVAEVERDDNKKSKKTGGTPLVLGCLDESRDVYVVVGMGGGGQANDPAAARKKKDKADKKAQKETAKEAKREARRREKELLGEDDEEETEDEQEDGSSDDGDSSEDESDDKSKDQTYNRFGNAFQEVVEETSARVRLDSFEHCVVEVKKEDLSGFLESLSMKAVVG